MGQAQSQGRGSQVGRKKGLTTIGGATVTGGSCNSRWQTRKERAESGGWGGTTVLSVAAGKWGQSGVAMQAESVDSGDKEKYNPGPERHGWCSQWVSSVHAAAGLSLKGTGTLRIKACVYRFPRTQRT